MNRIVMMASVFCLMLCVTACDNKKAQDAMQSAKDATSSAAGALGDMMAKGKDAVAKAAESHGIDTDKIIAEFKTKASSLSGDAKAKVEEGIKNLEVDRGALKQKIEAMMASGGDGWKAMVKEIDAIIAKMKTAIADIKAKIG